jgi:hypothetical protein
VNTSTVSAISFTDSSFDGRYAFCSPWLLGGGQVHSECHFPATIRQHGGLLSLLVGGQGAARHQLYELSSFHDPCSSNVNVLLRRDICPITGDHAPARPIFILYPDMIRSSTFGVVRKAFPLSSVGLESCCGYFDRDRITELNREAPRQQEKIHATRRRVAGGCIADHMAGRGACSHRAVTTVMAVIRALGSLW